MSRQTKRRLLDELVGAIRDEQDVRQAFDEAAAAALGVNLTDLRCLGILERKGTLPATALAHETRLTSGAMTALIDRLERAGYVRRVRDETDRRRVYIELTGRAKERIAALWGPLGREGLDFAGGMPADALRTVITYLQASRDLIARHLERIEREQ